MATLLHQHESGQVPPGDSRVYLAIPTLLLGPFTESLEGVARVKTVIYKFPHVSLDSFYEVSVVERLEDTLGRLYF